MHFCGTVLCDFQLLQNEVGTECRSEDWQSILSDCTSRCLSGCPHKNPQNCTCRICDALMIQLQHCATANCDSNGCSVCGRIVMLISLHFDECYRQQERQCSCSRYLATSSSTNSMNASSYEMLPVDRVRSYLCSVFQSVSCHDDDDDDDKGDEAEFLPVSGNSSAAADDNDDVDDDDHKGSNKDFDSDSSDDSLMMPSFSSSEISSPFQLPSIKTSSLALPGGHGSRIAARDLPVLSGRGVDTSDGLAGFAAASLAARPKTKHLEAAVASNSRICVSLDAPTTGAAVSRTEAITSVPVAAVSRPRGNIRCGTKTELRKFAVRWQNFADRTRENGTQSIQELPLEGLILNDFRHVSHQSAEL